MRFFLFLLCLIFVLPGAFAQSKSKKGNKAAKPTSASSEELVVNEHGLPEWREKDQLSMMKGEWFSGDGLLPDETDVVDTADSSFLDLTDLGNGADDQIELGNEVPKESLPLYRPKDLSLILIDPQNLLAQQEREDIQQLLEDIRVETGVNVHLVLFAEKQSPAVELNAPSLARHIFSPDTTAVLISYHLGSPSQAQVIYSNDLNYPLNDEKRKSLLDASKRLANFYDYPADALWQFIESTGDQLSGLQNLAKLHPAPKTLVVPKVDYSIEDSAKDEKKKSIDWKVLLPELCEKYGIPFLILFALILGCVVGWCFYKKSRKYPIPNVRQRPRLGAPYGAGTSRTFYFQIGRSNKNEKFLNDMFKD